MRRGGRRGYYVCVETHVNTRHDANRETQTSRTVYNQTNKYRRRSSRALKSPIRIECMVKPFWKFLINHFGSNCCGTCKAWKYLLAFHVHRHNSTLVESERHAHSLTTLMHQENSGTRETTTFFARYPVYSNQPCSNHDDNGSSWSGIKASARVGMTNVRISPPSHHPTDGGCPESASASNETSPPS